LLRSKLVASLRHVDALASEFDWAIVTDGQPDHIGGTFGSEGRPALLTSANYVMSTAGRDSSSLMPARSLPAVPNRIREALRNFAAVGRSSVEGRDKPYRSGAS
jgi:hypothetical protein